MATTPEISGMSSPKSLQLTPHPPNNTKAKLRLDPHRALEPTKKKLTTVESQRIMACLVEAIRRTELVTALPHIMEDLDRYRVVLGLDLVHTLIAHKVIVESFITLRNGAERLYEIQRTNTPPPTEESLDELEHNASMKRSSESRASNMEVSSQLNMTMRNLSLVAKQMQFSCRNILRMFSIDPSALNAVLKDQTRHRTPEAKHFQVALKELKDILMGMLLTTPIEEAERNLYLKEISQRERHNATIIKKLEIELQAALDDKDQEIRKKNTVIRRLKGDLDQLERFSNENIRRTKTETEKQETADLKINEGKRQKLQQDITLMKAQLTTLTGEHREGEQILRNKKYKIETQVENWIQKYDVDMGERQTEFEDIDTVYTGEKKQLNELEERFNTLELEYNRIVEDRRIARERREAAERELQMSVKAATIIQAFWRSYKVRKAIKSKKKKGKKGKKGKK